MTHPDSYRSENVAPAHKYIVIMYYAGNAHTRIVHVEADCYADAVQEAAPGNDVFKIEVIGC
jgi:hypothetical protein